jgi:hypothetical protein
MKKEAEPSHTESSASSSSSSSSACTTSASTSISAPPSSEPQPLSMQSLGADLQVLERFLATVEQHRMSTVRQRLSQPPPAVPVHVGPPPTTQECVVM